MKKQKQSMLIHVWEGYEFYLYIPETISRNSKPFIFYYYQDLQTNKSVRIKKFIGQCNGDRKLIQIEAKKTLPDIIELLAGNWNPIRNTYNELKITPLSTIKQCMDYWILARERSLANTSITPKKLKGDKILMMHLGDYLKKQGQLNMRATAITSLHIKDFLDSKALERSWNKVSFNSYRIDTGTFFNFLVDLTIIKTNPVKKVPKRSTKFDSSRFKVFELEELRTVANLLSTDMAFIGLHIASKILFKYNIRPLEITRIQVSDINWDKRLLTLPPHKTKNGHEAIFLLDDDIIGLLKVLINDCDSDYYIFCKRNKPSPVQTFDDYFGQRWRAFRKKYTLSSHLKFYALKHSSNYYDIENGANYEEIRQRNRHSNLQITTLYIKERLFKNVIKSSSSTQF
jgi:integrase